MQSIVLSTLHDVTGCLAKVVNHKRQKSSKNNAFKICRPHATSRKPTGGSALCQRRVVSLSCTFERAEVAALRGTDNGSSHFRYTVLEALCGVGVFLCLFLLLNVI